ncbi:MAG TPA: spermidine/putrescine ABC transporter substrate-binding protein [Gaiellales bacterium]|nr:spermidine/putrescine ABC transporter substrate-binding protein [Gaiellales bacterium]
MPDPRSAQAQSLRGLSRRQLLAGLGAAAAAPLLSGCGLTTKTTAAVGSRAWWQAQSPTGRLVFANWPLYIDYKNWLKDHPSLNAFSRDTGIAVTYEEVIENNEPFFRRIAPRLKAGRPLGYDLIVLTNGWQLSQLIENGWLTPLDHSLLPQFAAHAADIAKNPNYDPGNRFTIPWQSGFTGIAYNSRVIRRPITSVRDLWDPAFHGRVGMMSDNTDLGTAGMLYLGIDPARSTPADWQAAAAVLQEQRDRGVVRGYYDQHYIDVLEHGDTWISQAWSGDIFQAKASGYPELRFVVPREGVMHWTDNMAIPITAANPLSAITWMNYYYQPPIAAEVADWIEYITPVPAARDILLQSDPTVARSPLVFPTTQMAAKARNYPTFQTRRDFDTWNGIFDPIINS